MAKAAAQNLKLGVLHRSFDLERGTLNKEKRTVRVRFSSEAPVKRWFGEEILDHAPDSVDLSRMNAGAAVLMEHDPKMRCGITESATIMANKTGEAEVRFARTALGDSCMMEVEDGTLKSCSVGYRVNKFLVDEDTEEYRAMSWEPLEVSFVAIPADPSAQVLRSENNQEFEVMIINKRSLQLDQKPAEGGGSKAEVLDPPKPATPTDPDAIGRDVGEVYGLAHRYAAKHPEFVTEADRFLTELKSGKRKSHEVLSDFRAFVLEKLKTTDYNPPPAERHSAKTQDPSRMTLGERFIKSDAYRKLYKESGEALHYENTRILLELRDEYQFSALTRVGSNPFNATTESITSIQKLPGVVLLDQQPLRVADLIASGTTDGLTVRYIQEQTWTQAATAVAEGAAKPALTLDVSEVDATVRKIAAYVKATEEMLADFSQMSSFINMRLAYAVQSLEDNHLLNGTGSNNQIKGILQFSGLQTLDGSGAPLDAIFKGISYVRTGAQNSSGFIEPDAVIIHPLDWMNMRLTKGTDGQYVAGGPFFGQYGQGGYTNVGSIWGLPAVITTSIAQGTSLVGAFRMAAQIFRRLGLTIETNNSDQDDFIKNLVTVRAEERLALAVYKPAAFCTVTGIPTAV